MFWPFGFGLASFCTEVLPGSRGRNPPCPLPIRWILAQSGGTGWVNWSRFKGRNYSEMMWIYIYTYINVYIGLNVILVSMSFYIYLYQSIYIYLHLSTSIYIYLHLSTPIYIYLHLSTSIYLYLHLSIFIYIYLSTSIYRHLSIYIYLHLSIDICEWVCSNSIVPQPMYKEHASSESKVRITPAFGSRSPTAGVR